MMPGLHPGLLLTGKTIEIVGAPQVLHINTAGGEGTRPMAVALELRNAPAPFLWEFEVEMWSGPWTPNPASGSGTSNNGFVYFEFEFYHPAIGETALAEVGQARFRVTAADGSTAGLDIVITAGGTGTG